MIDIESGEVIEFLDEEIEKLQAEIAKKLGYKLIDHRMELYGIKIKD
jgi:Fur family ferric uptake transcriptional regulator